MGAMYAWATPDYLMDETTLDQLLIYYDEGLKFLELKAKIDSAEFLKMRYGVKKNRQDEPEEQNPVKMSKKEELIRKLGGRNIVEGRKR
jgi:hypothetical protein